MSPHRIFTELDLLPTILFWLCLFLIGYCYLGYALLAFIISAIKGKHRIPDEIEETDLPALTLVITAFQESLSLREKLNNVFGLDYPAGLLSVILVADEPDQQTIDILKEFPSVKTIVQSERRGKYAAICLAMQELKTELVVFSDANCQMNKEALKRMIRHYADPSVGAVAGEKKIVHRGRRSGIGQAEGWYWEYESLMKKLDAGVYTVVGAAGELFSIRSELFQPLKEPVILDDLVISLQICFQGYRIAYEPLAFATEFPSVNLKEEAKRKIRIAAGAFHTLSLFKRQLQPFTYPLFYFQFVSRRLFRWIISPFSLLLLMLTNIFLVLEQPVIGFLHYFLALQLLTYLLGIAGYWLIGSGRKAGIAGIPFYFLFMNYCLIRGFFRFLFGKQPVNWEKAQRETT